MTSGSAHIVVDGATGYLGTHLTAVLLSSGFAVNCLVHPGANRDDADILRRMGADVFVGSLHIDDEMSLALAKAFSGAVAAVHLIGSVAPRKGDSVDEMHAGQTHWFMHHVQKQKIPRVVVVTTLGTKAKAATSYQRSKWAAEQIVASSSVPYTILRPSLIVGRTVGTRDSKLVKRYRDLIAMKPFVPVIGGGQGKVQPVFVGDLVNAICRCIFPGRWQREATGKELEIGGAEVVPMRELVELLMDVTNVHKPIVSLPAPLAYAAAMYCEAFQEIPSVSRDQVKLSLRDNVCSDNALTSGFGIEPTPLRTALQTYGENGHTIAMGAES